MHQVRCSLSPAKKDDSSALILPRQDGIENEGIGTINLVKGVKVDAVLRLDAWNNQSSAAVGYRLKLKWALVEDLNIRLANWLGPQNQANPAYRSLFLSLLNTTVQSLPPPQCRTGWRLEYRH